MASEIRDPKNLPEWVELDYFRRERPLRRWRRTLAWWSLFVCLAGVAAVTALPGSKRMIQAGPVSVAHSMFNDDCSRCHEEGFQTARKFLDWHGTTTVVPDHACRGCHDGPAHNLGVTEAPACAACHREHRGREELARVTDGHCTRCHADLAAHRQGGADGLAYRNVTSFTGDHPEFALVRTGIKDPGRIHFNHEAHLRAGGVRRPDGTTDTLQCVRCHTPDAAGQYMQPINYEKHCAECHPLSVRLAGRIRGSDQERIDAAVKAFNKLPAPHLEPAVVRAVLRDRLLGFIQAHPVVAGEPAEKPVDPDLLGLRTNRPRAPSDTEWRWTRERLGTMERLLFPEQQRAVNEHVLFENGGGCRFCHVEKGRDPGGAELSALPKYEPTRIPSRWMGHSRFDHEKHRMLDCKQCHAAAQSTRTEDVLMPGVDTCRQCHNPSTNVRHDCAACHTYHNRALGYGVHKNLTIGECLGK